MDADVEPVPCRDCGTPTLPNMGWCRPCDLERKNDHLLTALADLRRRARGVLAAYQDGDTRGLKIEMEGLHRELPNG